MRTAKEIKQTLKAIEKVWLKNKELRLCQLIGNVFDVEVDIYYATDDQLIQRLKNYEGGK